MLKRLLNNVSEDLVCVRCTDTPKSRITPVSHQANGIDRPSFGATVIKTQSKHKLTEREQAWLVGDMV